MPAERVSPRQAVVVLPVTAEDIAVTPWGARLNRAERAAAVAAALHDVFGALIRVDGITAAIVAPPGAGVAHLLAEVPVGIEVIDPGAARGRAAVPVQVLPAVFRALLDRRFDRALGIAGDVVGLTPRIVATALSALGGADLTVGPTTGGAGYLVGVRDRGGIESLAGAGGSPLGGQALVRFAEERLLIVRRVEPLPRLVELGDLEALTAVVERDPRRVPRLAAAIGREPAPQPQHIPLDPTLSR